MKKEIFLFAVILVAGCVSVPAIQSIIKTDAVSSPTEDVKISVETPDFVKAGKSADMIFYIQAVRDLDSVKFKITDRCLFKLASEKDDFSFDKIRANKTQVIKIKYNLPKDINFDRQCDVRFSFSYAGKFELSQSVTTLKEGEAQRAAESKKIASSGPVSISFSWLTDEPFYEDDSAELQISYKVDGIGLIDSLPKNSVELTVPANLALNIEKGGCDDYSAEGGKLKLNREMKFSDGKAQKLSTCVFKATPQQPIDIRNILLSANYNYEILGSSSIAVKAS